MGKSRTVDVAIENVVIHDATSVRSAVELLLRRPVEAPQMAVFIDLLSSQQQPSEAVASILEMRRYTHERCRALNRQPLLLPPVIVFATGLDADVEDKLTYLNAIVVDPARECYRDCATPETFSQRLVELDRENMQRRMDAKLDEDTEIEAAPFDQRAKDHINSFPPGITREDLVEYFRHLNSSSQ
jgi:hypothetical protein